VILFLDFDGVLHGREVYVRARQPYLRVDGALFEHAGLLIDALAHREDVQIVLSTSWVPHLGFDRTKSFLPPELQRRVIGATYHRHAGLHKREWLMLARYYQISTYVSRHGLADWIAVDDDDEGWPAAARHQLIHCHDDTAGISNQETLAVLRNRLCGGSLTQQQLRDTLDWIGRAFGGSGRGKQ